MLVEQAKIIGASSPLIAAFTTSVATKLCINVVFPVPGGPLTAVIAFSSAVKWDNNVNTKFSCYRSSKSSN